MRKKSLTREEIKSLLTVYLKINQSLSKAFKQHVQRELGDEVSEESPHKNQS